MTRVCCPIKRMKLIYQFEFGSTWLFSEDGDQLILKKSITCDQSISICRANQVISSISSLSVTETTFEYQLS